MRLSLVAPTRPGTRPSPARSDRCGAAGPRVAGHARRHRRPRPLPCRVGGGSFVSRQLPPSSRAARLVQLTPTARPPAPISWHKVVVRKDELRTADLSLSQFAADLRDDEPRRLLVRVRRRPDRGRRDRAAIASSSRTRGSPSSRPESPAQRPSVKVLFSSLISLCMGASLVFLPVLIRDLVCHVLSEFLVPVAQAA